MLVLGLTGGIACGKSTISLTLAELGAVIVDGDVLSRELTAEGGATLPEIRTAFGDGVFHPDGTLNRRALGSVVFADNAARERLDAIMQPLLLTMILRAIEDARQSGAAACVLDMPLLYEKGLDRLCDRVWCAYIPREIQLERLMARDGFTIEEAENRLRSQMPAKEKAARADVIIDTSGTIQYTKEYVISLYAKEVGGSAG
ncbi:MAG: dephospho-CoA kinase [Clostridia bacterium]|nr:dephospho-CoA kinase [Clostridia bacterium]